MSTVSPSVLSSNPTDADDFQQWAAAQEACDHADDCHRADLEDAYARIAAAIPSAKVKIGRTLKLDGVYNDVPTAEIEWFAVVYTDADKPIFAAGATAGEVASSAIQQARAVAA